jgi:hypothetical protein
MKNCVYLKKNIDWLSEKDLNDFFDEKKRSIRDRLKKLAISSWSDFDLVVNSDEDPNNRVFHSTETCLKAINHRFIIPMDDDDILLRGLATHLRSLEENTGAVIWNCLEVDFVTGLRRTSFMLKQEDKPTPLHGMILLPGSYAVSNTLLIWAIENERVGDLFNFFSALETIKEGCLELNMILNISDDTHCLRPYTSACEYYLNEDIKKKPEYPFAGETYSNKYIDDIYKILTT